MSIRLWLLMMLALSACSSVTYRHGLSEFTRTTIGTDTEIQGLRITVSPDGSRTLKLDAVSSQQSQAIEAAARGAAAGAVGQPTAR